MMRVIRAELLKVTRTVGLPLVCDAEGAFALARAPIGRIEILRMKDGQDGYESVRKLELAKGEPMRVELP